jgi:hypothetical protein
MIEGCILSYQRLHAAYSRRELRILDVQFDIDGELPSVAMRTQIITEK